MKETQDGKKVEAPQSQLLWVGVLIMLTSLLVSRLLDVTCMI